MLGRTRPAVFWGSGPKRVIVILLLVFFVGFSLLPRQAEVLLQFVGRPVADVLAIPITAMAYVDQSFRDGWNQYVALQGVYDQNRQLHLQVQELQGQLNQLQERGLTSQRLTVLLDFQSQNEMNTLVARVIGRSASNWYRGIILNKGEQDGVRPEMGLITPGGVVGQIVKVASGTSIALLITDPNVAVTGLTQRTRDEGIIQGTSQGLVRMKYIPPLSSVQKGDAVVTSGLTGGFPRGLLIGQVLDVMEPEGDLFQTATISPVVDFGQLEEVLIILAPRVANEFSSVESALSDSEMEPALQ